MEMSSSSSFSGVHRFLVEGTEEREREREIEGEREKERERGRRKRES